MNKIIYPLICLFLLLSVNGALAQDKCMFSGKIVDQAGNPIPFTSIYIQKLGKGGMANIEGDFSLGIPCGKYVFTIQSLGYKTLNKEFLVADNKTLTITLTETVYELDQVDIDPDSEDPAFNIIRKATVMAELYKKQIIAYNSELYIRQFYSIDDLPWLAEKAIPEDELKEVKTGNVSETLLEYSFEKPNIVKERIIARKTGDNDTSKTGSSYVNLNFYNLGGPEIINPLSRGAFQVYDFEHINSYFEGTQKVHKIRLNPRRKGNDLMKGFIHINDGIWNLNKVEVSFKQTGGVIDYTQFYNKVSELIWMPVNHKIKVDFGLLGFKGEVQYLATLSELDVKTDSLIDEKIRNSIPKSTNSPNGKDSTSLTTTSSTSNRTTSKTQQKIEELITKEKLNNRETFKLVRLLKKQAEEERKEDSVRASLEVKRNYTLTYEDNAFVKNDSLWKKERDVPLSEKEKSIYVARDSLNKVESGDTVINQKRGLMGNLLFYDGGIQSENKRRTFRPNGLFPGLSGYFNTVDGFTIQKSILSYSWTNKKGKFYDIEPEIGYAISRKQVLGQFNFTSQYNMKKRAGINFSAGRSTSDFNSNQAMPNFINSVASLLFEENYPKFYQAEFFDIEHHIDLANGLALSTGLRFENRERLENNSSYRLVDSEGESYSNNTPRNIDVLDALNSEPVFPSPPLPIGDHKSTVLNVALAYTPRQYYRYVRDRKQLLNSNYPTFTLNYRQGIDGFLESDADFNSLSLSIEQSFSYRLINRIRYYVEAGKFLNNDQVFFADFKSFNASPFYVKNNNAINAFNLLDYYSFNTDEEYLEAHLSISDNHLLLKRLPLLNASNLTETFYLNYLITERSDHYYEIGYSLDRILLFMNLGIFASFEDDEFDQLGFRIAVDLFN